MKPIATESMTLQCTAQGSWTVQTPASTFSKIDGSGIYFGDVDVLLMAGATQGGGTLSSPLTVTITHTGTKVSEGGKEVLLLGDSGTAVGAFVVGQTSTPLPVTFTVTDAGQNSVMGV